MKRSHDEIEESKDLHSSSQKQARTDKLDITLNGESSSEDEAIDYWHKKSKGFFDKIIDAYMPPSRNAPVKQHNLAFIAVVHAVPTLPDYLKILSKLGNIRILIYKGDPGSKSRDKATMDWVNEKWIDWVTKTEKQENYHCIVYDKIENKSPKDYIAQCKIETIKQWLHEIPEQNCIILDIGGYFAPFRKGLSLDEELRNKLIGIVEDTENGHQDYQKHIKDLPSTAIEVYSVARSMLKSTEDYNVGKSIVQAADTMLRDEFNRMLPDFSVIGVMGFGKIGRSIAHHLRQLHVGTVIVCDIRVELMVLATSYGFEVGTKQTILKRCKFVFNATGNKSLNAHDFESFKAKNVYLASCTSPEKEYDLTGLKLAEQNAKNKPYSIYKFTAPETKDKRKCEKKVYLLARGQAINFHYKAVIGPYIRAVQANILVAAMRLINNSKREDPTTEIKELTPFDESRISQIWLETFGHDYSTDRATHDDIPAKNFRFVARARDIQTIEERLGMRSDFDAYNNTHALLHIHGSQGAGKTECVKEFVQQNKSSYELIQWTDFNAGGIMSQFSQFAKKLQTNGAYVSLRELLKNLISSLKTRVNWLLVFDGVSLEQYQNVVTQFKELVDSDDTIFTTGRKHIIVISSPPLDTHSLKIEKFEPSDSLVYINKSITDFANDWEESFKPELASACWNHPIILEKAMAYLIQTNADSAKVARFIGAIKAETEVGALKIISSMIYDEFTININIKNVLLALIFLNDKNIYRCMIDKLRDSFEYSGEMPKLITGMLAQHFKENPSAPLTQFQLLTLPQKNTNDPEKADNFTFHAMVKECLINKIGENLPLITSALLRTLTHFFQYDYYYMTYNAHTDGPTLRDVLPHIEAFLKAYLQLSPKPQLDDPQVELYVWQLMHSYADYCLHELRDYGQAEAYFDKMNSSLQQSLNPAHMLYRSSALIGKAICLNEKRFNEESTQAQNSVAEHLSTATNILNAINDESMKIKRDCYLILTMVTYSYHSKRSAESHRETEKALFQADISNAKKALSVASKILESYKFDKLFAAFSHAQGGVFALEQQYENAKADFQNAVKIRETALEPSHPDLARSLYKLSVCEVEIYSYNPSISTSFQLREAYSHCKSSLKILQEIYFLNDTNRAYKDVLDLEKRIEDLIKSAPDEIRKLVGAPDTPSKSPSTPRRTSSTSTFYKPKRTLLPDINTAPSEEGINLPEDDINRNGFT